MNSISLVQFYFTSPNKYLTFLFIFGGSFLAVYFLPLSFAQIFFIILFIYAFNSRHYGILAAFYVVLLMNPLFLFQWEDLPTYSLGPGMTFGVYDILGFILLIKALKIKKKYLFRKNLLVLFILVGFYFAFSFFDGSNTTFTLRTMRIYSTFITYFVFVAFLARKEEFEDFLKISLVFALLGVFDQILSLVTGKYLMSYISLQPFQLPTFAGKQTVRVFPTSFNLIYFVLVYIFYHLLAVQRKVKFGFIFLAVFTLSILITSTRQWFINLIIVFFFSALFTKNIRKIIFYIVPVIFFLVMGLIGFKIINVDYLNENVIPRYATIEEIIYGDFSTISSRVSDFDQVGQYARENFFFGMGFKADETKISNDISGFINNIVRFGILGALLFSFIFISPMRKLFFTIKRTSKRQLWTLFFVWLALLQQYLTVNDFFSFGFGGICLIMLILAFTENTIMENFPE